LVPLGQLWQNTCWPKIQASPIVILFYIVGLKVAFPLPNFMDQFQPIEKLTLSSTDDGQIKEMIEDCNGMIDRYNARLPSGEQSASQASAGTDQLQSLYIRIVNYKKKIEKIRMGY
jgi:hypothetical protein